MSHTQDAPILKTRHQRQHRSKNAHTLDPVFDSLSARHEDESGPVDSYSSSPSRRYSPYQPRPLTLRALRLPQIVKRHANPLPYVPEPVTADGPRFFVVHAKRAPVALGGQVFDVEENTNCRDVVGDYDGAENAAQVRRACVRAVSDARAAKRLALATTVPAASSPTTTTTTSRSLSRPSSAPDTTRPTTITRARRVAAQSVPARIAAVSLTADRNNPAAIESNVSEIFSEAVSAIASRSSSRAALATSVSSLYSAAASAISSRREAATIRSTASTTSSSTTTSSASTSSTLRPSTTSSSPTSSAPSSSTSATSASSPSSSSSDSHRVRDIAVPSVVIPVGLLLLFLLVLFCRRRRKRRNEAANLGPISGPRPLRLAGNYGTAAGASGGAAALAAGGGGRGAGGQDRNASNESFGTTPSASGIGVAVSEPRSKWGRRSLVEAIAGGVVGSGSSPSPTRAGGIHSRQESITSSLDRGTGGYNSKGGYRPGMPRPFSPVNTLDSFPTIIPVPPSNQRPASLSTNSGSDQSLYNRSQHSGESATARLARPITTGYPFVASAHTPGVESRTSTEGEQGYWTADAGFNSSREGGVGEGYRYEEGEDDEEALGHDEVPTEPVNFGSGSSNSSGEATPAAGGTPRLGSGHGSRGYRRGDSSWWG
ncbi:uncharacterized protein JCM15063_003390 [Sporobolomyces koalae]|uniref:uncharacterized protein n=1 Tax=Sporobolomyces koalae TaxID=500713 RepID=UPI003175AD1C